MARNLLERIINKKGDQSIFSELNEENLMKFMTVASSTHN